MDIPTNPSLLYDTHFRENSLSFLGTVCYIKSYNVIIIYYYYYVLSIRLLLSNYFFE